MRLVRLADQIPDFCRSVCVKLKCCQNLFGPVLITDKCPESCFLLTKTKYSESLRPSPSITRHDCVTYCVYSMWYWARSEPLGWR